MGAVTLLVFLAWVAWVAFRPANPSPTAGWAVREWFRVLRFRFAGRSFAVREGVEAGVVEVAPGVFVGDEDVQRHAFAAPIVTGPREMQVGRASLLNPPVPPERTSTRYEVRRWIEEARALGTHSNAEINRQAAKRFGVSVRLAQLAARDIGRRT